MQVIYDISAIGQSIYKQGGRAGTVRVVENILCQIVQSQECDLSLFPGTSLDSIGGCIEYLTQNSNIPDSLLIYNGWSGLPLFLRKRRFDPEIVNSDSFWNLLTTPSPQIGWKELKLRKRLWRRLAISAEEIINRFFVPLDQPRLERADIFHTPAGPISKYARRAKHARQFLTLYDMVPAHHPEYFTEDILNLHRSILSSLNSEDRVLCISQTTKNDFLDYVHFDSKQVFVTPLAASPDIFYPSGNIEKANELHQKYGIPEGNYFLTLNKLEPRKNIVLAIRAFAELIAQERLKDCYLVLAGERGWLYDSIFDEIVRQQEIRERIIITGYIADKDLASLYSNALAFIYPSFYEGFGLPPLEAMQCGTPVITSNTSSLPEVVGDAGIMIDPTDQSALSQAMLDLYANANLRRTLSLKGLERAKQFSWERCVNETIQAYKFAVANPN